MSAAHLDVNRVVTIATTEFAMRGFDGLGMRVLAEKCGVTAAALYYHFSSKEALYDEVCSRIFDEVVTAVEAALKGAKTAESRLERFVAVMFDQFTQNPTLLVLTQRDVINAAICPERSFSSSHYKFLFNLIRKLQSQYFGTNIDEPLSFAFGSMLFGYCSLLSYSQVEYQLPPDLYIAMRKKELLRFCKQFMKI